jgi:alkylation response protein AidB-like acyl-CoA dehydrogenase
MEFRLTQEQRDIQDAVRDFVTGEFKKKAILELEEKHEYPVALWKKAAHLGFIGIHFPEKYSGQGLGVTENILVAEELCRGDSSVGACLVLAGFASEILLRSGNDAQKAQWLPKVAGGHVLSCGAFTEPDHGSDITALTTTAVKDGDQWVINGTKTFITNGGPLAGFYCVLCQTDRNVTPSHRGLSLILVEADRPGVSASSLDAKMGIRMMHTAEVHFSEVKVPLSNVIGTENHGFHLVLEFFDESRIVVGAQAVGTAQGAFDRAFAYVKSRQQFGQRIVDFQITRHKLADMATKLEMARLLVYKAAWNFDQGRIDPKLTSMAKMAAARTAVEVCDEAIQLLGGYGYMTENDVERYYRDAKITEIYEGTKEIQKNTIAGAILGKIR